MNSIIGSFKLYLYLKDHHFILLSIPVFSKSNWHRRSTLFENSVYSQLPSTKKVGWLWSKCDPVSSLYRLSSIAFCCLSQNTCCKIIGSITINKIDLFSSSLLCTAKWRYLKNNSQNKPEHKRMWELWLM